MPQGEGLKQCPASPGQCAIVTRSLLALSKWRETWSEQVSTTHVVGINIAALAPGTVHLSVCQASSSIPVSMCTPHPAVTATDTLTETTIRIKLVTGLCSRPDPAQYVPALVPYPPPPKPKAIPAIAMCILCPSMHPSRIRRPRPQPPACTHAGSHGTPAEVTSISDTCTLPPDYCWSTARHHGVYCTCSCPVGTLTAPTTNPALVQPSRTHHTSSTCHLQCTLPCWCTAAGECQGLSRGLSTDSGSGCN
jgi:hypothetical protein